MTTISGIKLKVHKARVNKASDWEYEGHVEIKTLDDLRDIAIIHGCGRLVVSFDDKYKRVTWVTIYDDYLE